jgi:hypothetical protein
MPKKKSRKAVVFCTYSIYKGGTLKTLQQELAAKGYETILTAYKKGMNPNKPADAADVVNKVSKALEK